MKNHVIEFLTPGTKLSKSRGLMVVKKDSIETTVPLDDIFSALILAEDVLVSTTLITALLERKVPIIFCDDKYLPKGILLNTDGHHLTHNRQLRQTALSLEQRGRLWQVVITQKIAQQCFLLAALGKKIDLLSKFKEEVAISDKTNMEAQAARVYWRELFGRDFRREPEGLGQNAFLNYGYAVLRSAVARHVMASGLNPCFGIHHSNAQNPFCLVDDLMEPFRPIVDCVVFSMNPTDGLESKNKRLLASILEFEVIIGKEKKTLSSAINEYVQNFLGAIIQNDTKKFDIEMDLNFESI